MFSPRNNVLIDISPKLIFLLDRPLEFDLNNPSTSSILATLSLDGSRSLCCVFDFLCTENCEKLL
jgi:hypothetical protein